MQVQESTAQNDLDEYDDEDSVHAVDAIVVYDEGKKY